MIIKNIVIRERFFRRKAINPDFGRSPVDGLEMRFGRMSPFETAFFFYRISPENTRKGVIFIGKP